jgi:hypothetical protein
MALVKPRIVRSSTIGLHFVDVGFGELGPELFVTGHHTAGVKDRNLAHAIALAREYHAEHKAKGWGGIGYHFMIARNGTILCLRPTRMKGAHVGLHNTDNVGVVCNGTVGDKPTWRQARSLRWLLAHAHTHHMPAAHRTDRSLTRAKLRGHNDWSGHETNACPGTHKPMYLSGGKHR